MDNNTKDELSTPKAKFHSWVRSTKGILDMKIKEMEEAETMQDVFEVADSMLQMLTVNQQMGRQTFKRMGLDRGVDIRKWEVKKDIKEKLDKVVKGE